MEFKIETSTGLSNEDLLERFHVLCNFGLRFEKKERALTKTVKNYIGSPKIYEFGSEVIYTPYISVDSLEKLMELRKVLRKPVKISYGRLTICDDETCVE